MSTRTCEECRHREEVSPGFPGNRTTPPEPADLKCREYNNLPLHIADMWDEWEDYTDIAKDCPLYDDYVEEE